MFITMGVIWGVPYLMIKVAVGDGALTPAALVFLRTGVAAVLLLPVAAARGQLRPLLPRWRPLLAYTVAELAVPWLLLSNAERHITSSLAGLLLAAVPLVGALLATLTGAERLGPRRLVGLLVGLAGVAALVGIDFTGSSAAALIQMAVVAIGYALGPFILVRYMSDLPSLGVVAASLGLGALGYLPVGLMQLPRHLPRPTVLASVLGLAVLCTAVAFLVFFALIDEVGPVRATVITYINPAVAVALGVLFLHEPLTVGIGVGFVLILAGSVLATRRTPTRSTAPTPAEPVPATVGEP